MAEPKIYSIQPRFKIGDMPTGWSMVDAIFSMPSDIPPYGSEWRDLFLAQCWVNEPMTAGVFSTWVDRAKTISWTITGGRNTAKSYAEMFNEADNGAGWDYHQACSALDYLATDKGQMEELGREQIKCPECKGTGKYRPPKPGAKKQPYGPGPVGMFGIGGGFYYNNSPTGQCPRCSGSGLTVASEGKVLAIQHIDSTRMIRIGTPGYRWRYYPDNGRPVSLPDANLLQIVSMPSGRDRFRGMGYCSMSRLLDAKQLMLGYLTYFRQEIGNLPPELIAIINGLSQTAVTDSWKAYKEQLKTAGLDTYGKFWWLGSDDSTNPVSISLTNMTTPNKSFSYQTMVEWWAKMLALNTGEDVGEYWLIQASGATKAVQSVQALKSRGKGFASFLQEKERRYNSDILPYGVTFEFDEKDDEQDAAKAEIMASNIGNLAKLADVGVSRQEPMFTTEEVRKKAVEWGVISSEMAGEETPNVVGSILKHIAGEDEWVIDRWGEARRVEPLLHGREAAVAMNIYKMWGEMYGLNGKNKVGENGREFIQAN